MGKRFDLRYGERERVARLLPCGNALSSSTIRLINVRRRNGVVPLVGGVPYDAVGLRFKELTRFAVSTFSKSLMGCLNVLLGIRL